MRETGEGERKRGERREWRRGREENGGGGEKRMEERGRGREEKSGEEEKRRERRRGRGGEKRKEERKRGRGREEGNELWRRKTKVYNLILLFILSPRLHVSPIPVEYPKALPLLTLLTETNNFNQAGVWLKHGECLHMTQELEQAVISYARVLSLAPHHTETRMTLASLYSQLGMTEEALELLDAGGCGL